MPPCFSEILLHVGSTQASSLYISITTTYTHTHKHTQPHKHTHFLISSAGTNQPISLLLSHRCLALLCVCVCVWYQSTEMLCFCALVIYLTTAPPPLLRFLPSHAILHSFFEREMHNSEGAQQHPDSTTVTQSSHTYTQAYTVHIHIH